MTISHRYYAAELFIVGFRHSTQPTWLVGSNLRERCIGLRDHVSICIIGVAETIIAY